MVIGISLLTRRCVTSCSDNKASVADTLPKAHLNDSLNNSLSEGKAYHEMDSLIERYLKRWEINGAQLVITRNDSLLYARGFGWADKEKGIKMQPSMVMRYASVSKLITAVGIMKLWEAKKLSMGDKVFGPKGILRDTLYNNSIKDKRYYDITVEQLLRHQAGFTNYAGDPISSTRYIMMQNRLTTPPDHPTLLKILLKRHLGYTPGEGKCYSNFGYILLSMIIEKKSGMRYEDYMQKYVLNPAGCYDMHIANNYYEEKYPNESRYFVHEGDGKVVQEYNGSGRMVERCYGGNDINLLKGAGAWVCSAAELALLVASIDGKPGMEDILLPESVEEMLWCRRKEDYAIGWNETNPRKGWIRTGTLAGTNAVIKYFPDGECWIFLSNTSTWKGPNHFRYTSQLFDKLRRDYSGKIPSRNLFEI